jgi:transposase
MISDSTNESKKTPTLIDILDTLAKKKSALSGSLEQRTVEASRVSEEERHSKALALKYKGIPLDAIADQFKVTVRTLYRWFSESNKQYREQRFEDEDGIDLLSENMATLEQFERVCMYEVTQSRDDRGIRAKFLALAMKARKAKIDLQLEVGLISREPSKLYTTVRHEGQIVDEHAAAVVSNRSREQLLEDLIERLSKARTIS